MNEKIKTIWNKAASSHEQAETSWQTKENFLNRFAELIIAECMIAVDNTDTTHAYTTFDKNLIDATIVKSNKSIKKHFGIQ